MKLAINDIRRIVVPLARKYRVKSLALFGSYARGDADSDSDVDILIDCGQGRITGMLTYLSFVHDLEAALNCHVDVVTSGISDKEFLSAITQEAMELYAE